MPAAATIQLLTPAQVAAQLAVSRRTVERWARRGELRAVVLTWRSDGRAGTVRFRPETVAEFIRSREARS